MRRRLGQAWKTLRSWGWRALLVVLGVVISLEVVTGVWNRAYTKDYYQFVILPLPVIGIIVFGIVKALSFLRKRLIAGFVLSFFLALVSTILVGFYIFVFTRFSIPQVTSYVLAALAGYEVWLSWKKGVFRRRTRRPKHRRSHGH